MNHHQSPRAARTTPEWDFPQLLEEARTVNFLIYYSICYSLLISLWLFQLVPWLQVPISREEEDSNCWPTSPTLQQLKRVCTSLAEGKIKELTKLKAPRGVYSEKTSPAESPPVIKSPPPVLRERPKHTQPSPSNELVKLHQIVKKVHILYKKACTHYHILKGTQICYTKRH